MAVPPLLFPSSYQQAGTFYCQFDTLEKGTAHISLAHSHVCETVLTDERWKRSQPTVTVPSPRQMLQACQWVSQWSLRASSSGPATVPVLISLVMNSKPNTNLFLPWEASGHGVYHREEQLEHQYFSTLPETTSKTTTYTQILVWGLLVLASNLRQEVWLLDKEISVPLRKMEGLISHHSPLWVFTIASLLVLLTQCPNRKPHTV